MVKFFEKLFPARSRIAVLLTVATNFVAYYGAMLINLGRTHYHTEIVLDTLIPFLPFMVLIYIAAFLQWAVGYLHLSQCDSEFCYTVCAGLIAAKLICFLVFIIYPTRMAFVPEIKGSGFIAEVNRILQRLDAPSSNLFPSIHCLESWICLRVAFKAKRSAKWYKIISVIVTVAIFVSVVTVKQHYVLDIPAGIAVAEFGLFISKKFRLNRLFFAISKRCKGRIK